MLTDSAAASANLLHMLLSGCQPPETILRLVVALHRGPGHALPRAAPAPDTASGFGRAVYQAAVGTVLLRLTPVAQVDHAAERQCLEQLWWTEGPSPRTRRPAQHTLLRFTETRLKRYKVSTVERHGRAHHRRQAVCVPRLCSTRHLIHETLATPRALRVYMQCLVNIYVVAGLGCASLQR